VVLSHRKTFVAFFSVRYFEAYVGHLRVEVGFGEFFADYIGEEGQVGLLVGGGNVITTFHVGIMALRGGECAV
jgi:hypothetical protein